jgi:hypothetical protein
MNMPKKSKLGNNEINQQVIKIKVLTICQKWIIWFIWYSSDLSNISFLFLENHGHLDPYAHLNLMYVKKSLEVLKSLLILGPSMVKWTKKFVCPNPNFQYGSFSK